MNWVSSKRKVPKHLRSVFVRHAGAIRVGAFNPKDGSFRLENGSVLSSKICEVHWAEMKG